MTILGRRHLDRPQVNAAVNADIGRYKAEPHADYPSDFELWVAAHGGWETFVRTQEETQHGSQEEQQEIGRKQQPQQDSRQQVIRQRRNIRQRRWRERQRQAGITQDWPQGV